MRDKDLYAQILGITYPCIVQEVELRFQVDKVTIHLDLSP